ncbi:MAG: hypothetical protein PX481_04585 [Microcystis sp. M53603_WE2]|nr:MULTISPECIES: hypothetical protein [Microcystis]MDJ0525256.1 hypothetical protein [Microcystis sp. M53600_WE12]MDJ0537977.1 hypothetical protein [Microcystis sp. M53603_WE2]MDJ0606070.1 hypothetical protein [Microcystis sp. M53602_WE12]
MLKINRQRQDKFTPVWDTVISSLVLGLYIRDPRSGLAFPD